MSFLEFVNSLIEVNKYSGLPGIIFFLVYVRRGGNARIAFFILLASFLADASNYFFIRYVYPNSYIISNSWYLLNYVLVTWLFSKLIPGRQKFIHSLLIVFTVGSVLSFIFFYSFLESNTFIRTFSSIAFALLAILTFFEILRESPTTALSKYPIFWIVTGIFLYSSVTLLRNLFQNYLVFELEIKFLITYVAIFNIVFNIAKNLMFFYAFILIKKGQRDYIYKPSLSING